MSSSRESSSLSLSKGFYIITGILLCTGPEESLSAQKVDFHTLSKME